mmetsp:Transcript_3185/g.4537  ORF Transcript_3185/g.4537 Transcript_3185/m.4537 type:complete len:1323 (-) Transcript_3185:253-4221(-)|eukprot:CAMPEP_0170120888 /NCGR_PEP_ID=MMETSP0020_2-20130122/15467_1 /TAXON_ID=98059 /ORGANISM="Dinobryon sp., Strain UTEXLB2267" /LENGTH=1322 /DNA_ID=CAMNT_0010350951 /DNA_START=112 /DNA_END=4080 /DNA_ORIENTATION=-
MSRPTLVSSDSLDESFRPSLPSWAAANRSLFQESSDEAATPARRRFLECTSTQVEIVNSELQKGHVIYEIQVSCGFRQWAVYRRFRDFFYLDQQLRKYFTDVMPVLPPKRFLRSSTDPEFVDERKGQLQIYLTSLVANSTVWTRNDIALFLDTEANFLMLIWYFERMRRMQDMLSSMTIMNEEEKATLNSDLFTAKKQVAKLQQQLSVMEMIFLQHATGMASEALPSSVMRSLSGADGNFLAKTLAKKLQSEITDEHKELYELRSDETAASAYEEDAKKQSLSVIPEYASSAPDSAASSYTSSFVNQNLLIPADDVDASVLLNKVITEHVQSGDQISSEDVVKVLSMTSESSDEQALKTRARFNSHSVEEVKNVAFSLELKQALRIAELLGDKVDISGSDFGDSSHSKLSSPLNKASNNAGSPSMKRNISTMSNPESELYLFRPSVTETPSTTATSPQWIEPLMELVDDMLLELSPTKESLKIRHAVFNYIRSTVSNSLGVQLFPVGSFATNTYLPDSNINTTAFVVKKEDDAWFVRLNEALCMSIFNGSNAKGGAEGSNNENVVISNVSFVNTDKKMIKSLINNICVDVAVNQVSSLYNQSFVEEINHFVGKDNLFKRSILLVKAWCRYESPRHTDGTGSVLAGSKSEGRLTAWAVIVMLTWVFNSEGENIFHPLQALGHFLRIYSSLDWERKAISVHGLLPAADPETSVDGPVRVLYISPEVLDAFTYKSEESPASNVSQESDKTTSVAPVCAAVVASTVDAIAGVTTTASTSSTNALASVVKPAYILEIENAVYEQGFLNIIDPTDKKTNLCQAIDSTGYVSIVQAFQEGYKRFQALCENFPSLYSKSGSTTESLKIDSLKILKMLFMNTYLRASGKVSPARSDIILTSQKAELEYSLRYAEFVLGGKINQAVLIQLIIQILQQKGPMPVGEVGKNLQILSGCDALSRRLKEQFGGLKKAIELSNCPRLRVGTEHPFNPNVYLVGNAAVESTSPDVIPFGHAAFVYMPVLAQTALNNTNSNNNLKNETMSAQSNKQKIYRRPPPFYMDRTNQPSNYDTISMGSHNSYGYNEDINNNYNANARRGGAVAGGGVNKPGTVPSGISPGDSGNYNNRSRGVMTNNSASSGNSTGGNVAQSPQGNRGFNSNNGGGGSPAVRRGFSNNNMMLEIPSDMSLHPNHMHIMPGPPSPANSLGGFNAYNSMQVYQMQLLQQQQQVHQQAQFNYQAQHQYNYDLNNGGSTTPISSSPMNGPFLMSPMGPGGPMVLPGPLQLPIANSPHHRQAGYYMQPRPNSNPTGYNNSNNDETEDASTSSAFPADEDM